MNKASIWNNGRMRQILVLVTVSYFLLWIVLSTFFYRFTINNYQQNTLIKLAGIANSVAMQIDGDRHDRLMALYVDEDEIFELGKDSLYDGLHDILKKNFKADMLKTAIYTLVMSDSEKYYEFGVTSNEKPYFRHRYDSYHPSLNSNFDKGGMIEGYTDEFGMWLSSFAPIKNKSGKTVAVVMVDERFDDFVLNSRQQLLTTFLVILGVFLVMILALVWVLRNILIRENRDKIAISQMNVENKLINEELTFLNGKLSKLDSFRKEMISNISHDLRTPIASILGFLALVKSKDNIIDETEKSRYIDIAFAESTRLNSLISELFELTKLESGQIKLQKEPFNLIELVSDIIAKYQLKMKAKHIQVLYEIHDDVGLAYGDIKYIDRVFQNLLDNAVRYVDEGGVIKIWILNDDSLIKIKICNTGELIDEKYLETIFDRYYLTDKSDGTGSGLGLAIAKGICTLHGCTIRAEVNDEVNSFWFTVPKVRP